VNLFYLDEDIDKCAEYHVDSHVNKMVTESAQLLTTAVWVDHLLGHVPRALTKEELGVLNEFKGKQPPIEERTFTRFLPTHPNHPCAIWTRTSMDNFEWTFSYCDALNSEFCFRYRHQQNHKSFDAATKLPQLSSLPYQGLTVRPQCMPEEYHDPDPIAAYRLYYMCDKAPFAVWKRRDKPYWWDEYFAEYGGRDPHLAYLNTVKAPTNKGKPHSRDYEHVK
jgi:hypothetical protein